VRPTGYPLRQPHGESAGPLARARSAADAPARRARGRAAPGGCARTRTACRKPRPRRRPCGGRARASPTRAPCRWPVCRQGRRARRWTPGEGRGVAQAGLLSAAPLEGDVRRVDENAAARFPPSPRAAHVEQRQRRGRPQAVAHEAVALGERRRAQQARAVARRARGERDAAAADALGGGRRPGQPAMR
jgi:hypothetical protein